MDSDVSISDTLSLKLLLTLSILSCLTIGFPNKIWIASFQKDSPPFNLNYINETAVLRCHVSMDVPTEIFINFQEYSNGKFVDIDETDKILWSPISTPSVNPRSSYRTITFFNATREDERQVYCVVYSKGKIAARKGFNLTNFIEEPPATTVRKAHVGIDIFKYVAMAALFVSIIAISFIIYFGMKKYHKSKEKRNDSSSSFIHFDMKSMKDKKNYEQSLATGSRDVELNMDIDDSNADYDVNICYSPEDKEWVVEELLTQLEAQGLRTFINVRDFKPGLFHVENMTTAISKSSKTIAVLSEKFLADVFCNQELQTALSEMAHHQVIPILYSQCNVPESLKDKTYLEWCHEDVKPHFWKQLFKAVKKSGRDVA